MSDAYWVSVAAAAEFLGLPARSLRRALEQLPRVSRMVASRHASTESAAESSSTYGGCNLATHGVLRQRRHERSRAPSCYFLALSQVLGDAGKDTGMTVHKYTRRGKPRWVIDNPYRHRKSGKRVRFRKDADVQTSAAAHAEERRLIAEYEAHGFIRTPADKRSHVAAEGEPTKPLAFQKAYELFMETNGITRLKLTTRMGYGWSAKAYLLPRWGKVPIAELGYVEFERLDADLKKLDLKPTTRANVINAGRSVLRWCVASGRLRDMPRLPQLPKGGETVVQPPTAAEVIIIRLQNGQAARPPRPGALRRCGSCVRGRFVGWSGRTSTSKESASSSDERTVYYGKTDTPKSGHQREIPLTRRLHALLTEAASRPAPPLHRILSLPIGTARSGGRTASFTRSSARWRRWASVRRVCTTSGTSS